MEGRQRAYEISFNFPAFRTKESEDGQETNAGRLHFLYCPKDTLLEFHSFQEYINQYSHMPTSLEAAAWSILDDIFDKIQPCYASINIEAELPDCVTVNINANRGWLSSREESNSMNSKKTMRGK